MKPIEPLLNEHRLIERMVKLSRDSLSQMSDPGNIDLVFIDKAVDFFKTYTDDTHHGKEEGILFRELGRKPISDEHKKVMSELLEEHVTARKIVQELDDAKKRYLDGDTNSFEIIRKKLMEISDFYPLHIEKEDKHFFRPAMEYFSEEELDSMLKEFWDYDREMIHKKYREVVENLEK